MKRATEYVVLNVHQATTVAAVREQSGRVICALAEVMAAASVARRRRRFPYRYSGSASLALAVRRSGEGRKWRVAAELLVPMLVLRHELRPDEPVSYEISRLARLFKSR